MTQQQQMLHAPPTRGNRAALASRIVDTLFLLATLGTVVAAAQIDNTAQIGLGTLAFALTTMVWALLGMVYIIVRVRRIRRARRGDTRWAGWLAGRRTSYLITLGTAVTVILAGLDVAASKGDDINSVVIRFFSIIMVLLAWIVLQLAYAERYARLFLSSAEPPMEFPATPVPTMLEFAYFSFTIGTTFGTSDVEIRSTRLRGIVLCHGILVFVYNTAIIGMVISLISS
jgi:uncharacterized membrane protein